MRVYSYNPATGEFVGDDVADPSPLEDGVWLIPANATTVAPPAPQPGKAIVWTGSAWALKADHRGETWYGGADGREPVEIKGIGDPAASGYTAAPRPDTPEEARERLIDHAGRKRLAVEAGGISIGGMTVATDRTSQAMLTGAVLASQADGGPTEFRWKSPAGFVTLTAEQVRAMAVAVSLHVQACFAVEAQVVEDIEAGVCTSTEAIDAYVWPS